MRPPLAVAGVGLSAVAVAATALPLLSVLVVQRESSSRVVVGAVRAVQLDLGAGDARVVATDRADVLLERTDTWSFTRPDRAETLVDGTLQITSDCSSWLESCATSYVVEVPTGVRVVVRSGAGDVEVQGGVDVDARSSSGDVDLSGGSGALVARSGSGDVRVTSSTVSTLRAEAGSGDVRLRSVTASELVVDLGSGDLSADLSSSPGRLALRSGSGNLTVASPTTGSPTPSPPAPAPATRTSPCAPTRRLAAR